MPGSSGDNETWGWLVVQSSPVRLIPHTSRRVSVGRQEDGSLYINDVMFREILDYNDIEDGLNQEYIRLSRRHFVLEKKIGDERPVLTDLSMNGTWIDTVEVGKDRAFIVNHCSAISLLSKDLYVFQYLDKDAIESSYPTAITQEYIVGEVIGKGTTSEVRVGYKEDINGNYQRFALKMIKTKQSNSKYKLPNDAENEIEILEGLDHPCILKYKEVFNFPDTITIVMEHAAGGELLDALSDDIKNNSISERVTKIYGDCLLL